MKNILIIFLFILFISGCANKEDSSSSTSSTDTNTSDFPDNKTNPCGTNCIPKATELKVNVIIDKEKTIQLEGSDEDNDPLTYTIAIQPSNGTLTVPDSEGSVSYKPNQGFLGKDSFYYRVSDGKAESDSAKVSLSVNPDPNANYRLEITPSEFKVAQGGQLELKVRLLDANDGLILNSSTDPVIVTWSSSDSSIATVSSKGLVKGVETGTTTLMAMTIYGNEQVAASANVTTEFNQVAALYISPSHISLDKGGERKFDISGSEKYGTPTSLSECSGGVIWDFDTKFVTKTGLDDETSLTLRGIKEGMVLLTGSCSGIKSTPAVIEIKETVEIPAPQNLGLTPDFGIEPSLALNGSEIHLSSYDRINKKLFYTSFNNTWRSVYPDAGGDYGHKSQIALDPLNDNRPVICALKEDVLTCWKKKADGTWAANQIGSILPSGESYQGNLSLKVNKDGKMYLLYYDQKIVGLMMATSTHAYRNDWTTKSVVDGGGIYSDLALNPDEKLRVALQFDSKAYYGTNDASGDWTFEEIDSTVGSGTGIKLAIGSNYYPQAIYYTSVNKNLVLAVKSEGSWSTSVIQSISSMSTPWFGFALNRNSEPRVSFYDPSNKTLLFAKRNTAGRIGQSNYWDILKPHSGSETVGLYSDLKIDQWERTHISYHDSTSPKLRHYVEPRYLDYHTDFSKSSGSGNPSDDQVTVPFRFNRRPVPVAGADQMVQIGDTVSLDASGSSDPDQESISFLWEFSKKPISDNSTINAGNSSSANFIPDVAGKYELLLKVTDERGLSSNDNLTVWSSSVRGNYPPMVDAGPDNSSVRLEIFNLDGSGSYDLDSEDSLSYQWSFVSRPEASSADFSDRTAIKPTLQPTKIGKWVIKLEVSDGKDTLSDSLDLTVTRPLYNLTVDKIGSGLISSAEGGIDCGENCSNKFEEGSSIKLTATPALHYQFSQWNNCDNESGSQCTISLGSDKSISATFIPITHTLTVNQIGSGTITSSPAGIDCGSTCQFDFNESQTVKLTASGSSGFEFNSWSGCNSAIGKECSLEITENKTVTASYIQSFSSKDNYRLSGGAFHTCALISGGTIKCWGFGSWGELGNGSYSDQTTPVSVNNISNGLQVSSGEYHTCSLLSDGKIMCWGRGDSGQIGNGWDSHQVSPVEISGITNAIQISSGVSHTCALLSDSTVKCWGNGKAGQLGNNATSNTNTPQAVQDLSGVTQISSGKEHTCALLSNGTIRCWGDGSLGQLGNGSNSVKLKPVTVSSISNATSISSGYNHTCALISSGSVLCWGQGIYGQLGNSSSSNQNSPLPVSGLSSVSEISSGGYHTCTLMNDGTAKCWGNNYGGQLGNNSTEVQGFPVSVVSITNIKSISAGGFHTCAFMSEGTVKCWGQGDAGQLGNSGTKDQSSPVSVTGLFLFDMKNPSGSISINNGDSSTTSQSVTLTLSATDNSGVTSYYASESSTAPSSTTSGWVTLSSTTSYSANVSYTMTSVSGNDPVTKTVYVWFKDSFGNISQVASDSISYVTLDESAPTSPSISINSGSSFTSSSSVTLSLSASDTFGVTGYYISTSSSKPNANAGGWTSVSSNTSYSADVNYSLSSTGSTTLYAWFKDSQGNISSRVSDSIEFIQVANIYCGNKDTNTGGTTALRATKLTTGSTRNITVPAGIDQYFFFNAASNQNYNISWSGNMLSTWVYKGVGSYHYSSSSDDSSSSISGFTGNVIIKFTAYSSSSRSVAFNITGGSIKNYFDEKHSYCLLSVSGGNNAFSATNISKNKIYVATVPAGQDKYFSFSSSSSQNYNISWSGNMLSTWVYKGVGSYHYSSSSDDSSSSISGFTGNVIIKFTAYSSSSRSVDFMVYEK